MTRDVTVTISLKSVNHNAKLVRQFAPQSSIMAMVKSNGYGHGIEAVATSIANQVSGFGVATLDEALTLRKAGIQKTILLTQGVMNQDEMRLVERYELSMVVHHQEQIHLIQRFKKPMSYWLKLDTGMSRLGFSLNEFSSVLSDLIPYDRHQAPVIMTHFANADVAGHELNSIQETRFNDLTSHHLLPKSVCNSAVLLRNKRLHHDWVRPGIMLYGISPFNDQQGEDFGLKPAMTLQAKLISIKKLNKGDFIGYGSEYRCKQDRRLGIVNIGYGDGYPRHAKSGTPVLINDIECMLVGRVSMDMLAVILPEPYFFEIGDKVTLWGEGLPVERVAECAGTIAYELINKLTRRVNVRYLDEC